MTPATLWTYRAAGPTPSLAEALNLGAIHSGTTQDGWDKLTPGMKREIVRTARKKALDRPGKVC